MWSSGKNSDFNQANLLEKVLLMFKKSGGLVTLVFLFLCQLSFGQSVFQSFDLIVSDPGGVVAALNKAQASPLGQDSSARVYLYQYLANGDSQATHSVLVVHDNAEEMGGDLQRNLTSSDWATFISEMNQASEVEAEVIGQFLAVGGDPSSVLDPNRVALAYQMSVTDPAAYARAWTDFVGANAEVGVSYLSASVASGNNPATHVAVNWANSVGELMANQPQNLDGWDTFSRRVRNIRTVESTNMMMLLASWNVD